MRKKLIASVGIAGLILLGVPTAASALTTSVVDDPGGVIAVDGAGDGTPITRTFEVDAEGLVTQTTLLFDFQSSRSDTCTDENDWGYSYADELGLLLRSPAGTEVLLVSAYPDETFMDVEGDLPRVQILFDDAADYLVGTTNDGMPESGTFQPVSPLAALNGEVAAGVWEIDVWDSSGGAAQCYYGATLNIETDAVDEVVPPVDEVKSPVTIPTPPAKIDTAA